MKSLKILKVNESSKNESDTNSNDAYQKLNEIIDKYEKETEKLKK